jgi:lipopolysaccharide export system protein LptA
MLFVVPAGTALEGDRRKQLVIEADQLEGDEQAQITRLEGDVRLQQGTLDIRADSAVLYGPVKSLKRVVVEGNPAKLDQELEDRDGRLHAEANRVDYDLVARRLELTGNAVVDQGNRRLTGDRILYDLAADRVIGEGRGEPDGERVRIRIDPEDGPENE